ncbi:hypothetical protein RHMOL_Rhmol11G0064700 [Rhododendron molle]|uniref:Uncharacterized protein n=1 Tax=Rhododendron molle TaxID=49168 RepID=A0ACC0LPE9_RHOML|nr:hypothetical protein RHMOL_Rhmol11G0064700 [Rhododendron molle]
MYGDCQVLSSMGVGNGGVGVSTDSMFSSPIQNPSFNFLPNIPYHTFSPLIPKEERGGNGMIMMRGGKEEMDQMSTGSGSEHMEGLSGNEQETDQQQQQPPPKKKRYHRHTARQIQEMEAMFKECPHPDDKQRMKLSQDLGLKPRQVKFWFQNRRTQMKAQQDRQDNVVLRQENDNLKTENYRLQAALRSIMCPNCGGPAMLGDMAYDEQQLRLENARLKDEFERVCCLASRYSGRPIQAMGEAPPPLLPPSLDLDMSIYPRHFEDDSMPSCNELIPLPFMPENSHFPSSGDLIMEEEKPLALDLAMSSMDELVKLCQTDEPLWMQSNGNGKQVLNFEEHARIFHWSMNVKPNPNATSEFRLEASRDAAVVIMNSITLVDAFLDANKWVELFPSIISRAKTLQIITSGVSGHANGSLHLVTWVENAEVEDKTVHQIFDQFVESGMAFGAQRWLAVLQRQCERIASLMARNISDLGVIPSPEARKNLMNLAQRMIRSFSLSISTSCGQSWTALSDSADDTVRITTRKITEPGQPSGLILSAVSTTWLPHPHYQVFDLLRDERRRAQLDVLSNGNSLHEVAHIANGSHPGNCISLLRINVASNSSQNVELMLQESCTDQSGSIVVYATVNVDAIQLAMNTDDPSSIPLLPLGFVITPLPPPPTAANNNDELNPIPASCDDNGNLPHSGCLLTVGLQVLASTIPTAKLNLSSVTAINNLLCNTVHQINDALIGGGGGSGGDSGSGGHPDDGGIAGSPEEPVTAAPPDQTD